jgi:putative membrane protein
MIMFIDFVAVMLVNLAISLVLLAYLVLTLGTKHQKKGFPGLFITGFISVVTGLYMIFTWPLPSSYNIDFGGPAVLLGALVFGLGLAVMKDWDLISFAIFSDLAGISAIVLGAGLIVRGATDAPMLSGSGYILTGLAGLLALPLYFGRRSKTLRIIVALILLAAALIWAFVGYGAYWKHMDSFSKWKPLPMR